MSLNNVIACPFMLHLLEEEMDIYRSSGQLVTKLFGFIHNSILPVINWIPDVFSCSCAACSHQFVFSCATGNHLQTVSHLICFAQPQVSPRDPPICLFISIYTSMNQTRCGEHVVSSSLTARKHAITNCVHIHRLTIVVS